MSSSFYTRFIFMKSNILKPDLSGLIRLISLAWIITKMICYKLWFSERFFPLVPVHEILSGLPAILHSTLFVISIGCMLLLLVSPGRKTIMVLLLAELLSCCLDQNRWQPWEYQFIFMYATFVFCKAEKDVMISWQLIVAGLYFFGGVGKLNSGFIHDTWKYLMLHRWLDIGQVNIWVTRAGYLLPLVEMIAGFCLLFSRTRKPAMWVLILMHLLILIMLGPAGLSINHVVWPWNILMIFLLYSLFNNKSFSVNAEVIRKPASWVVIICWWILPWFQLSGHWDKYLSSVLYSGGVEQLFICTDNPAAKKDLGKYMDSSFSVIPCSPVLSVYNWGIREIRTAPYPEQRIQKAMIRAWKKKYPGKTDRFYIYKPGFAYTVKEIIMP